MSHLRWLLLAVAACGGAHATGGGVGNEVPPKPVPGATCPASVDTTPAPGVVYATWVQAWNDLNAEGLADDPPPTDAREAQTDLCEPDGCDGDGPWLITSGGEAARTFHLAVAVPEGVLVFRDLASGMGGRCAYIPDVSLQMAPVRVHVNDIADDMVDMPDGTEACFANSASYSDYVFDLAKRVRVAAVERDGVADRPNQDNLLSEDWHDPVTVEVSNDLLSIDGAGCDQQVALSITP